jgi:hypothetical protein
MKSWLGHHWPYLIITFWLAFLSWLGSISPAIPTPAPVNLSPFSEVVNLPSL